MSRKIDLTGQQFGKLIAIKDIGRYKKAVLWHCQCDCGRDAQVTSVRLRCGSTRSCGCLTAENNKKHGMKNTPEYEAWAGMKKRCLNPNFKSYNSYGGRGIKICQTWQNSFEQFYKDMGPRPSFEHSVDRIDNNGDYTPNNCRWATRSEQSRNKSVTRLISFKGKTQCLTDWAKEKGLSKDVLWRRLKAGWSIERALTSPIRTWN